MFFYSSPSLSVAQLFQKYNAARVFHVVNFPNDACSASVGAPADETDQVTEK